MKYTILIAVLAILSVNACKKSDPISQTQTDTNNNGSNGSSGGTTGGTSGTATLSITDFSPKSAKPASIITITGNGFGTDASLVQVAIGNSPYDHPVSLTPTTITIKTNLATSTGKISVIVNGTKVTSIVDFTALPEDLRIISMVDGKGNLSNSEQLGHQMYIYADGLPTDTNKIFVSFGGTPFVKANYIGPNHSAAGAIVPRYAQPGKVTLMVNDKTVISDGVFNLDMSIRDFSPKTFSSGDTVRITGVKFTSATDMAILFNQSSYVRPFIVTPTEMLVVVPSNAVSGYLEISSNVGTVRDDFYDSKFTVIPIVSFNNVFTPASGKVGDLIRINGNFSGADRATIGVLFGGSLPVLPTSITGPDIYVKVPADAKTGKITIIRTGYKALTGSFIFTITP